MASFVHRNSLPSSRPPAISRTKSEKGCLLISNSVDFWKRRISLRATVPGLKRVFFFPSFFDPFCFLGTLPEIGICFAAGLGTLLPVRAVCFVLAIISPCLFLFSRLKLVFHFAHWKICISLASRDEPELSTEKQNGGKLCRQYF